MRSPPSALVSPATAAMVSALLTPPALPPAATVVAPWQGRIVPTHQQAPTHVSLVVSVDWEGTRFNAEDLAAFRQFREDFPSVRLTHFLNAAYYTQLAPDDVRMSELSFHLSSR